MTSLVDLNGPDIIKSEKAASSYYTEKRIAQMGKDVLGFLLSNLYAFLSDTMFGGGVRIEIISPDFAFL